MRVLLIGSPFANLANIERALRFAGAELEVSVDPGRIRSATRVVLPGVGSFAASAKWLRDTSLEPAIHEAVARGAWFLGICVGHQLLFSESTEMGLTRGIGLISGTVGRFNTALPVPQIGWNSVRLSDVPLFEGVPSQTSFYFVNSYRAADVPAAAEIGVASYGERFPAAVQKGRVAGVQFHPEKSSVQGIRVLQNFVRISC